MMRIEATILAATLAVGPVPLARAAEGAVAVAPSGPWSRTFAPQTVAAYMDVDDGAYLVVAAGAASPERDAAVAALRAAMEASGRARLVADGGALGDVSALGDPQIVEAARALPVDRIWIVRVSGSGEAAGAMVTIYDGTGGAVAGAAVRAGEPMPPRGDAGPRPQPADPASIPDTPQEIYDREYLHLKQFAGVTHRGQIVARWAEVFRGKQDEPIDGDEFYEILGREDLAQAYRRRRAGKIAGYVVGAGVGGPLVVAGVLIAASNGSSQAADFGSNDPLGRGTEAPGTRVPDAAAYAMIGVGLAALVGGTMVGALLPVHPVDEAEAARMIDAYNRRLRRRLGLVGPQARRTSTLRLGLAAGPGGGSVTVGGRF